MNIMYRWLIVHATVQKEFTIYVSYERQAVCEIPSSKKNHVKLSLIFFFIFVFIRPFLILMLNASSSSLPFHRNKAIADYLRSNGYEKALNEFQKEADMVSELTSNWSMISNLGPIS